MKAVVLHSGGLDSSVALYQAMIDGAEEILSLSILYGSKHNEAESRAADNLVWYVNTENGERGPVVTRRVIDMSNLGIFDGGGRSALMGDIEMPHNLTYQDIHNAEPGESPTVVPYRNGVLIAIAAAVAETLKYDFIYVGTHGEDAHNWAYPDCTPEFLGPTAAAVYVGTYHRVRLKFPFDFIDKAAIVTLGHKYGLPFWSTWSCYDPVILEGEYTQCGTCPTCMERKSAFQRAGVFDPTTYLDEKKG